MIKRLRAFRGLGFGKQLADLGFGFGAQSSGFGIKGIACLGLDSEVASKGLRRGVALGPCYVKMCLGKRLKKTRGG